MRRIVRHKCSLCGEEYWDNFDNSTPINALRHERILCYECAYWINLTINHDGKHAIIKGKHFIIGDPVAKLGYGAKLWGDGKMKHILFSDFTIKSSNDILFLEYVPDKYLNITKNSAWWISRGLKTLITRRQSFRCNAIACLDRYNCMRFNIDLERLKGPYNTVPSDWTVGGEHCGDLIDMNKITAYTNCIDNKITETQIPEIEKIRNPQKR